MHFRGDLGHLNKRKVSTSVVTAPNKAFGNGKPLHMFLTQGPWVEGILCLGSKARGLYVRLDDHFVNMFDEVNVAFLAIPEDDAGLSETVGMGTHLAFFGNSVALVIAITMPVRGDTLADVHVFSMPFDPRHSEGARASLPNGVGEVMPKMSIRQQLPWFVRMDGLTSN